MSEQNSELGNWAETIGNFISSGGTRTSSKSDSNSSKDSDKGKSNDDDEDYMTAD